MLSKVHTPVSPGLVVSICLFGAFFGCALTGVIADGIGRRRSFQLSTVPMVLGVCARYITLLFPISFVHNNIACIK
jgi:MFS family permease